MLQLTKIFYFEMAHAIYGYSGACKNIHGHSYELHVSVSPVEMEKDYIPAPGFIIDFRELKKLVISAVIETLDHKLVLSKDYLAKNPAVHSQENLVIWEAEPTAENLLIYIQRILSESIPPAVKLAELKLYETKDSYATWFNNDTGR
jgi:6-pyruvoyltetrahydropterin/6-carboxytetrahydropterin synthase